jgi:hypothetical protein
VFSRYPCTAISNASRGWRGRGVRLL